jgi:hypothetical protein
MTKTELDVLWNRALREALEVGEQFTRYRFAAMVASAEREACAMTCEQAGIDGYGTLAAAALIRKRSEA